MLLDFDWDVVWKIGRENKGTDVPVEYRGNVIVSLDHSTTVEEYDDGETNRWIDSSRVVNLVSLPLRFRFMKCEGKTYI